MGLWTFMLLGRSDLAGFLRSLVSWYTWHQFLSTFKVAKKKKWYQNRQHQRVRKKELVPTFITISEINVRFCWSWMVSTRFLFVNYSSLCDISVFSVKYLTDCYPQGWACGNGCLHRCFAGSLSKANGWGPARLDPSGFRNSWTYFYPILFVNWVLDSFSGRLMLVQNNVFDVVGRFYFPMSLKPAQPPPRQLLVPASLWAAWHLHRSLPPGHKTVHPVHLKPCGTTNGSGCQVAALLASTAASCLGKKASGSWDCDEIHIIWWKNTTILVVPNIWLIPLLATTVLKLDKPLCLLVHSKVVGFLNFVKCILIGGCKAVGR